ncbi:phosphotransferase family protein [Sphingobium sp. LMC3-1-1.1]|uniref:phosphotransferase family protein n=1 Tax=unclassified Sphingobium TaxID=2611147 RepID=UPI003419E69C
MTDIDAASLSRWLVQAAARHAPVLRIEKFAGGQSNPTYRVGTADGDIVLRRKPFGPLLPSAHAIEREYRLLSALQPTGFPIPRPIALCQDSAVIGAPFYLMEMVKGANHFDGALPEVSRRERRRVYETMIDTLAALHKIDYAALGLEDFGRPGNYFTRQVGRWTTQYRAAQTEEIAEVERLIDWLPRTVPLQTATSIIHGDYRIDNLIFAPDYRQVRAVIDWELATIGDPIADFAYLAMNWALPRDGRAGLAGIDLDREGIPTLDEAVQRYCTLTGRESLPDLHWYFAYNLFRLIGILQGVKKRLADGNASSTQAATAVEQIGTLAHAAWDQAQRAGAGR